MNKADYPLSLRFGILCSPLETQLEEQGRCLQHAQLEKYEHIRQAVNYLLWHNYITVKAAEAAFSRLMDAISQDQTLCRKEAVGNGC